MNRYRKMLLIAAIFVGAIELRCPITGVGSLVPMIRESLELSHALAGMITTIPLVAFGVCSLIVSRALRSYRTGHVVIIGILLIGSGIVIRSFLGTAGLFAGTLIIGIGISIGNVATPAIIKAYFPERVGIMTGTYTALMAVFSSIASFVAVGLGTRLGWNLALFVWIIIPVLALALWIPNLEVEVRNKENSDAGGSGSVLRHSMSWWIAIYMGVQTLFFYCFVSWFATILQSKGYSAEVAGLCNSCYMLMGIPGSFSLPMLAAKRKNQSGLGIMLGILYVIGLISVVNAAKFPMLILGILCCGYCQGACFSFVMALMGLHTRCAADTSALSGFSQALGYMIASVTPACMGYLYDVTENWDVPLKVLIALAVVLTWLGYMAGRNKQIG